MDEIVLDIALLLPMGHNWQMANVLHVNQLGYLLNGSKCATLDCAETIPVRWDLHFVNSGLNSREHIATGYTIPTGVDITTGLSEHIINFTGADFTACSAREVQFSGRANADPLSLGGHYLLTAGGTSVEVNITPLLYDEVLVAALRLFTLQRSGYEIGPDVAGPQYARAAGHLNIAPNKGDIGIPPLPAGGATTAAGIDLYDGWSGDYQIDARGGWYDAGDAGKYVVNGGISVAGLLGIVERAQRTGLAPSVLTVAADIALSEALWELDWMIRMQVANGLPYAGMVHHKVSDEHWTSIPMLPADDPQRRFVHRPSTAATLNFAAVAAQAARILLTKGVVAAGDPVVEVFATDGLESSTSPLVAAGDPVVEASGTDGLESSTSPLVAAGDPVVEASGTDGLETTSRADLADRYLTAARKAWAAALENPALYAPDTNVLENPGSGPYNDTHLDDEFYWAAVELYLATGEAEFLTAIRRNGYHLAGFGGASGTNSPWAGLPDQPEVGFDWRDTAAWARLQLALHGDRSWVEEMASSHWVDEAAQSSCLDDTVQSSRMLEAAPSAGLETTSSQAQLTELQDLRADLIANAQRLAAQAAPFGQLYNPASGKYNWGSNAMIANNAAIVAAAAELSGDNALKQAALAGLDYLFGRNSLDLSYVTGYGNKYVHNQHSRWFAAAVDPSLPHPPSGTLSGGPNSDCPDAPSAALIGQPAQFCFIDDIASYGTNEMTINWNAALAWLLAYAVTVS